MNYKHDFVKFMCESGVLTFGDFTAKSGRKTPYFVNTGNYRTAEQIAKLGEFYADCIHENGLFDSDLLFGPAYKGIPLAVSAAIAYYKKYGKSFGYFFNRKEEKDHGEGGSLVGCKPKNGDNVLIIEDVITAGTAINESVPILRAAAEIKLRGVVISVDRMERGKGELSAVQEVKATHGMEVYPIVTVYDIIESLENGAANEREYIAKIKAYLDEYGVSQA